MMMFSTIFQRLLLAFVFLIGAGLTSSAQQKRWEHNLYFGIGWVNKLYDADNQTTAIHIGYAINHYLDARWSVKPGIAIRMKDLGGDDYHTGNNASTYIDIPLLAQYHFSGDKRKGVVAEFGPVISFLAKGKKYDDWEVTGGSPKVRDFDLGLQPAIYYETGNWRLGIQSHISLLDTKCKYTRPYDFEHDFNQNPDPRWEDSRWKDSYYAFDIVATFNYFW